jgi:hypothetical protein
MKKQALTLLVAALVFYTSPAQTYLLVIKGSSGKFYLDHTVAPKENWYSVGRLYNISPRIIAPFNGLTIDKPLAIGQILKVPLTPINFDQSGKKQAGETLVPLYHIIQEKEWMYHISTTYNKIPVVTLEKWNHITADQAKAGMQLIVGWLKVQTSMSALANQGAVPLAVTQPTQKETSSAFSEPATRPATTTTTNNTSPKTQAAPTDKPASKPVAAVSTTASEPYSSQTVSNTYSSSHAAGGFFTDEFAPSNKMAIGQAATFKSTSGWQDGKYYALMNNIAVGTIVKVTNPTTSKSIYAKVLGQLPDMKESTGLTIRISNAAASELGAADNKFPVEIRY